MLHNFQIFWLMGLSVYSCPGPCKFRDGPPQSLSTTFNICGIQASTHQLWTPGLVALPLQTSGWPHQPYSPQGLHFRKCSAHQRVLGLRLGGLVSRADSGCLEGSALALWHFLQIQLQEKACGCLFSAPSSSCTILQRSQGVEHMFKSLRPRTLMLPSCREGRTRSLCPLGGSPSALAIRLRGWTWWPSSPPLLLPPLTPLRPTSTPVPASCPLSLNPLTTLFFPLAKASKACPLSTDIWADKSSQSLLATLPLQQLPEGRKESSGEAYGKQWIEERAGEQESTCVFCVC